MFTLDIDRPFAPLFGSPILITDPVIFYRGYDSRYNPISNRITHFGTLSTAQSYATISPQHTLGCFCTTRPLRLLDLRYIMILLRELFRTRSFNANEKMEAMARITLSYGICSFIDQLKIATILLKDAHGTKRMQQYYDKHIHNKTWNAIPQTMNPFTPEGIRIGETNNDALSLIALKQIFGSWIDGFIAPRMESVFHYEKGGYITAELVIFDPTNAGIQQIPINLDISHPPITMDTILGRHSYCHTLQLSANDDTILHKTTIRVKKGGLQSQNGYISNIDEFFIRLEEGDKEAKRAEKQMLRFAKDISKQFHLINPSAPHPTVPLSPW